MSNRSLRRSRRTARARCGRRSGAGLRFLDMLAGDVLTVSQEAVIRAVRAQLART